MESHKIAVGTDRSVSEKRSVRTGTTPMIRDAAYVQTCKIQIMQVVWISDRHPHKTKKRPGNEKQRKIQRERKEILQRHVKKEKCVPEKAKYKWKRTITKIFTFKKFGKEKISQYISFDRSMYVILYVISRLLQCYVAAISLHIFNFWIT